MIKTQQNYTCNMFKCEFVLKYLNKNCETHYSCVSMITSDQTVQVISFSMKA